MLCAVAALLLAILAFLAGNVSGPWFSGGPPLTAAAVDFKVLRGLGQFINGGLYVTTDASTARAVVLPRLPAFSAEEYPLLEWDLEAGEGVELTMVWRSDSAPGQVFDARLPASDGPLRVSRRDDPHWRGRIASLALVVAGPGDAHVWVRGVRLTSGGTSDVVASQISSWFRFRAWQQMSINFWYAGYSQIWLWWPVAVAIELAIAMAMLALWCRRANYQFASPALAVLLLAGWIAADLPWMVTAVRQAGLSWRTYRSGTEGLPPDEASLKRVLATLAAKLGRGRVFVFSDMGFLRGRLAYDLLPRSVYGNVSDGSLPAGDVFRAGDQLVCIARQGLAYDPVLRELKLDDGSSLDVDLLHDEPDFSLFRVRAR
jgi:hypothetical protein